MSQSGRCLTIDVLDAVDFLLRTVLLTELQMQLHMNCMFRLIVIRVVLRISQLSYMLTFDISVCVTVLRKSEVGHK